MAITCTVCRHPQVETVDALTLAGHSHREVAAMMGLSRHALDRHVGSGHVVPPVPSGARAPAAPDAGDLDVTTAEGQVRAIIRSLDSVDETKLSQAQRMALLDQRRKAAESLSRIGGPVVVGDDRPTWRQVNDIEAVLMEALEAFPDARKAMAGVLRQRLTATRVPARAQEEDDA